MRKKLFSYHNHTYFSLGDSTVSPEKYIEVAKKYGQTAISFSEHGNLYEWIAKKMACDKAGLKYVHSVEAYLTQSLHYPKIRDNYHVILLAKNYKGVQEINEVMGKATLDDGHFYHNPRITFEEFLSLSDNVITTSACLGGPLNKMPKVVDKIKAKIEENNSKLDYYSGDMNKYIIKLSTGKEVSKTQKKIDSIQKEINKIKEENKLLEENITYLQNNFKKLLLKFDYLEIQPYYNLEEQKTYNKLLWKYSRKYGKKLIAATDAHFVDTYTKECREVLKRSRKSEDNKKTLKENPEGNQDFGSIFLSYDEMVERFRLQGVLPESVYLEAIENTCVVEDMVEDFELDLSFKYPDIPGVTDEEAELKKTVNEKFKFKLDNNIIDKSRKREYLERIREEFDVFKKIGMLGFMLFMSKLISWCKENNIPTTPCRGSVGGSLIAYITDITDVDAIKRETVFARFCNVNRKEIGDIDVDIAPDQRDLVYNYIISSYPETQTAFILSFTNLKTLAAIDGIGRSFNIPLDEVKAVKKMYKENKALIHKNFKDIFGDKPLDVGFGSKSELETIRKFCEKEEVPETRTKECLVFAENQTQEIRDKYPVFAKYLKGLYNVPYSQSIHPAGIVVCPPSFNLDKDYGIFHSDGKRVLCITMDECHEVSLVKYDILGLKQVQIERLVYEQIGIRYPWSHEIDWNDKVVWKHLLDNRLGIFQFESQYSFSLIEKFKPQTVDDLTLVNASLRPSGASYRDKLLARIPNKNPSPEIDKLLEKNLGYLVYQEDTIKFLQDICGLTGSEADDVRRGISRKQTERLEKALPQILKGYCENSISPKEKAIKEANEFLKIIEDSANYQFGYNHATGYSMTTYRLALLRTYFPAEFIVAYLNSAKNIETVIKGDTLAKTLDISYLNEKKVRENKVKFINSLSNQNITVDDLPNYPKRVAIYPPTFGKSKGAYSLDKDSYQIYKGVGSIKGLNAVAGNELYDLGQREEYQNIENLTYKERIAKFVRLFTDIISNTSIKKNQMEILIQLNFFRMFAKNKTLLKIYNTLEEITDFKFDKFATKEIKKENVEFFKLNKDALFQCLLKETPTKYKVDFYKYFEVCGDDYEDEALPLKEQLDIEKEKYGSYITTVNTKTPIYLVENLVVYDYKNKPYLTLHNLKNNTQIKCYIGVAKIYINAPIQIGDLIKNCEIKEIKKDSGKIIRYLNDYTICDN